MRNRRLIGFLQNLTIIALVLSAVFLISRMPLFSGELAQRVQDLLSPQPVDAREEQVDLREVFPSVHLAITGESEYGRYVRMYAEAEDGLLRQFIPLLQEALGSAAEVGATADQTLRQALDAPNLYLDLTVELPLSVVASWLGEESDSERGVRALVLSVQSGDNADLYLLGGSGDIFRCSTALPAYAVLELCGAYAPNGGRFAYEDGIHALPPYTLLPGDTGDLPQVASALPPGATAYNLLTALDFNAHTLSRYTESSGIEVVEESPRTLRISPDGDVSFSSRGDVALSLYQVPVSGETPTALEAVQAAQRLAQALTGGTDASPLYLRAAEPTEDGWIVRFRYQAGGVAVLFPDEADALAVTVSGAAITAFTYRSRSYSPAEELSLLLPASMAAAIAGSVGGTGLSLGYVDTAPGQMSAQWIPN